MKVGTKSVLFGAHCFFLHPFFVAEAWRRLYGFPWQPWLWVMFFIHDLGYWGKPNMDGEEGEEHPWWAAKVLYKLQTLWMLLNQPVFYRRQNTLLADVRWWQLRRRWVEAWIWCDMSWGNTSLYHSRFLSKRYATQPSKMCWADKFAIFLTPSWLYVPMVRATGEIYEYMKDYEWVNPGAGTFDDMYEWHRNVRRYCVKLACSHADGQEDTVTRARRESPKGDGVWE